MSDFACHPTDSIARLGAHSATLNSLILEYEDIVLHSESMPYRYGLLQGLASKAIATVEQLSVQLEQQQRPARHLEVVRRNEAPAPFTRPGA